MQVFLIVAFFPIKSNLMMGKFVKVKVTYETFCIGHTNTKKSCTYLLLFRSSPSELIFWICILHIFNKFIGEHPCRSIISEKLLWRSLFSMSTSEGLLLMSFHFLYSFRSCTFELLSITENIVIDLFKQTDYRCWTL